jgi:hypothetical protein
VTVDSFVVAEELRQVLGTSVRNSPLELSWVPRWNLWLISFRFRNYFYLFFSLLIYNSRLFLNDFWFSKFFPLVIGESSWLSLILKADNSCNFTNVLFNLEHFVHVS